LPTFEHSSFFLISVIYSMLLVPLPVTVRYSIENMGEEHRNDEFRLENVSLEFGKCFEGENVRIDKYIDAYRELIR